jgi:glycolate oxidase FAD binding subunit
VEHIIEQWQHQIARASEDKSPLNISGGGSKHFYGRHVVGNTLNTTPYSGIVSYEPSELVVTARAGTPLAALQDTLAEHNQALAFEPPHFGPATAGGCVAAGLSGPRRMRAGPLRDFVLGAQLLDGSGSLLNFGGQVMKNVAGYDISRLLAGSLGTLGIITEVSLKVLPAPEYEQTQLLTADLNEASALMRSWSGKPLPISATLWSAGELHVRLSGANSAVQLAAKGIGGETLEQASAQTLWRKLREQELPFFTTGDQPLWRLALPASTTPAKEAAINENELLLEWNGGQCWLRSTLAAEKVRAFASSAGGHATLFRGGERSGDIFTPLAGALLTLHQRLKNEFDPEGIFNPGRIYPTL